MSQNNKITITTLISSPVAKAWEYYTDPKHIVKWNQASADWHSTKSENDLKVGGRFTTRMEAKDGSAGFDFSGEYTDIKLHQLIKYIMDDQRVVEVVFAPEADNTRVTVTFDAENENSLELQQQGWQAILDSFRDYTQLN